MVKNHVPRLKSSSRDLVLEHENKSEGVSGQRSTARSWITFRFPLWTSPFFLHPNKDDS